MTCEEKARLLSEYETAAVTNLQHKIGTSTKPEYERLNRAADEDRLNSEQARLALEQHIAAHNC